MRAAVLIVAAGRGSRAGGVLPKQYQQVNGEKVLRKTIKRFCGRSDVETILVAIHPDDEDLFKSSIAGFKRDIDFVYGADTRTGSVHAGLKELAKQKPDIVLIHDAARPFVTPDVIDDVFKHLLEHDCAVPGLPVIDALKSGDGTAVDR